MKFLFRTFPVPAAGFLLALAAISGTAAVYSIRLPIYMAVGAWLNGSEADVRAVDASAIELPDIEAKQLYVYDSFPYPRVEIESPRVQLGAMRSRLRSGRTTAEVATSQAKAYLREIASTIGLESFEGLREVSVVEGNDFSVVLQRTVEGIEVEGATATVTIRPDGTVTHVNAAVVALEKSVASITHDSGFSKETILLGAAWLTARSRESIGCERYVSATAPHLRWRVRFGPESIIVDANNGAFLGHELAPTFFPYGR